MLLTSMLFVLVLRVPLPGGSAFGRLLMSMLRPGPVWI